jgi:hypothetical protein
MHRLLIAICAAALVPSADAQLCRATTTPTVTPLVELFTSQGCSSCPPADRWLSAFARDPSTRAVTLALHVGYWDYIGWKDPFARREFNERQSRLAALGGSRTVYTPEVFVQGREAHWRESTSFNEQLRVLSLKQALAAITLDGVKVERGRVELRVESKLVGTATARDPRVYVAVVQSGLSSKVTAGENRGEVLANDRVARAWSGPLALGSHQITLEAPAPMPRELSLVAFVEDASGVLQSVQLPLAGC